MRMWSLHPNLLDRSRLLGAWREGLLALHVLDGRTKGYRHHPQLQRWQSTPDPLRYLGWYMLQLQQEAAKRGYNFDLDRVFRIIPENSIYLEDLTRAVRVSRGQLRYESRHLSKKTGVEVKKYKAHPIFRPVPIQKPEPWEVLRDR